MTKVYVSIDMEGVAGIASPDQVLPGRLHYLEGRRLMTAEANAVALGCFEAGVAEVLVNDSHGPMDNLLGEDLDPRVEYLVGTPKRYAMVDQLDGSFDAMMLIGYHVDGSSVDGVLAHCYSGAAFAEVRLNGAPASELELNALVAGLHGVPVVLVSGDSQTCDLAAKSLPGVGTVAVKTGLGFRAARTLTPVAARDRLRQAAAEAVASISDRPVPVVPDRLTLEVTLRAPGAAEYAGLVPGTQRIAAADLRRDCADPLELLDILQTWGRLSAAYASA
ncbi:MAG: D-amino peptidase [Frankiales bacterium]|nr:D-amino peptidase [Frankiales bacterium]